jgi:hypothetical protein
MGAFGVAIPVTGPGIGYLGQVSRTNAGEPVIAARLANANNANNITFADAVVLQPDQTGGTYTQVADWLANGSTWTSGTDYLTALPAPQPVVTGILPFAGFAVREVKTLLTFPLPAGTGQVGYYAPGQMCEVLERGSCISKLLAGTPKAGNPVYLRILAHTGVSTVVGGIEASLDGLTATTMTASAIGTSLTFATGTDAVVGTAVIASVGIAPGTYVTNVSTNTITINQNTTAIIPAGTPVQCSYNIMLPDVIFATGVVSAYGSDNVVEVTILKRIQA